MSLPSPQELPTPEHGLGVLLYTLRESQSHDDEKIRKIAAAMRTNLKRQMDSLKVIVDKRWDDEPIRAQYGADKKALAMGVLKSYEKTDQKLCDGNSRFYKIPLDQSMYGGYAGREYFGLDLMVAHSISDMKLVFDALGCKDKENAREDVWKILTRLGEKRSGATPLYDFHPLFSLDNRFSPNAHIVETENPPMLSFVNIPLSSSPEMLLHGSWQYDVPPHDLTQGRNVSNVRLTLATELSSLANFICTPEVNNQVATLSNPE